MSANTTYYYRGFIDEADREDRKSKEATRKSTDGFEQALHGLREVFGAISNHMVDIAEYAASIAPSNRFPSTNTE
jgi:hypothetical protein